jgi:uncharacterized protein (TIGR03000 family)
MFPKAFAGALFFSAASILFTSSPVLAQSRGVGGGPVGPVGGFRGGGSLVGGMRPIFPSASVSPQLGVNNLNAYRPNSGYIPNVGYYLPTPTFRFPGTGYGHGFSWFSDLVAPEVVEPSPTGRYIFGTPPVEVAETSYPRSALNMDTVIEPDTVAHIQVKLPAQAELWFGGAKVPSTGPVRTFQSPTLNPDRLYTYEVRASWKEDGRDVTQAQQIVVSAGARVHLDFVPPAATTRPAGAK